MIATGVTAPESPAGGKGARKPDDGCGPTRSRRLDPGRPGQGTAPLRRSSAGMTMSIGQTGDGPRLRARLGAADTSLGRHAAQLAAAGESAEAARSRIADADQAREVADATR